MNVNRFPKPTRILLEFDPSDLPGLVAALAEVAAADGPFREGTTAALEAMLDRKDRIWWLRRRLISMHAGVALGLLDVLAGHPEETVKTSAGVARQLERGYPTRGASLDMRNYFAASREFGVYDTLRGRDTLIEYDKSGRGSGRGMSAGDATFWRELVEEEGS